MSYFCAIDGISFCVFDVISSTTPQPIRFNTMVCHYSNTHLYLIHSYTVCCSTLYISLYYALCSLPPPTTLYYIHHPYDMYLAFFAYFLPALEALWKYELLQFLLSLCLCSSMCRLVYVHTCYGGQRSTLGTALQESSTLFCEPGSLTGLTLVNIISWMASEPPRSAGLCVPKSVTTSAHQTETFVMWVLGSTLGPHSCKATILLSAPSPQPFVTVLILMLRVTLGKEQLPINAC